MRIEHDHVTGLVIDIQERLFPHIYEHQALAERCAMLIRGLRILDVPLLVTQQYTKGLGPTITPITEALGEFHPRMLATSRASRPSRSSCLSLGTDAPGSRLKAS